MLPYLNAETSFIRAFGNRSLLLIFLCALTRSNTSSGKASALGITLDLNPGLIVVFGPGIALLFLISLKIEADSLLLAREAVLEEASKLDGRASKVSWWAYLLFLVPALAAAFMTAQFILKLAPQGPGCKDWAWTQQFTDFTYSSGVASVYCIRDLKEGTPWIYPPIQTYLYITILTTCGHLTYRIWRDWPRYRALRM